MKTEICNRSIVKFNAIVTFPTCSETRVQAIYAKIQKRCYSKMASYCGLSKIYTVAFFWNLMINCYLASTATISTSDSWFKLTAPNMTNIQTTKSGQSDTSTSSTGYWFNKRSAYEKCPSVHDSENDQCKTLLLTPSFLDMTGDKGPDYAQILRKTVCVLQKLNCPAMKLSFQLHDIPCQSACLAAFVACGGQIAGMPNFSGPSGLGTHWYVAADCPNIVNHGIVSSSIPANPVTRFDAFQPSYMSNPYFFNQAPVTYDDAIFKRRSVNARLNRWSPGHDLKFPRYARSDDLYPTQTWRVGKLTDTEKLHRYDRTMERTSTAKRGSSKYRRNTRGAVELSEDDCYLLPPGGCDLASLKFGEVNGLPSTIQLKVNTGCPQDVRSICAAMFPREFSRHQWAKGEYTVVAIIKISQVLWWFGENDRFQPFFRFHVVETLQTDIHPYDDKMILTYSWPTTCVCPGEVTVGKTYLMLTHSFKARQTLNISNSTVFLSRVRRFSKRLACWRGSCPRQRGRNRKRRVPNPYWRFNTNMVL